ncbi:MAG TPA: O-antigen ligase family protein [Chthoniobacterales bacterium]|nr:O-antigen ligase family protein [Chthoniobacterales bacterium]
MENALDQPESGRRITAGPFPEAFLALLPVLACFLGGATQKTAEGIVFAVLGIFLVLRPPRYSLGWPINLVLFALLLWPAVGFLPANWFYLPTWRVAFTNDLGISLPPTVSPQPWITLSCWVSLLAGLCWLYVMCSEQLGLREARTAVRMYTAGIVILAAICVLLWLRHSTLPFWHNARGFGPFPNRNQTGNLFGLAAIMVLVCGLDDLRKGRKRWIAWVVALGFVIAAVILNYSRAGVGLLVAGSALWLGVFSLRQRSVSKVAVVVSFLLLLGTALLVFGGQTLERFNLRNLSGPDISGDFRWRIFSDVFQLLRDSPWVGIGLGNFSPVFATFRAASFNEQRAIHPESDWLWLWSELGWVAVVLVIAGFVLILRKVFPLQEGTNQRYRLSTLIAAILFALHGLVDVSGHRVGTIFAAIFLLGISVHRPFSFRRMGWPSVLFRLTGLALVVIGVSWAVSARGQKLLPGSIGVGSAKHFAVIANQEHDFKEAVRLANIGLQWAPLDWELYFSRAIAEVSLKQNEDALADFRRARFIEPSSFELPLAEGTAWLAAKQPQLAATAWQEALRRAGQSQRASVYARMLSDASLHSPELRRLLAERGVSRHDLALPYLSQLGGAEFNSALTQVLNADPNLTSYSEPEKLALFSLWSDRGDGEMLARAIQQHPDWLSYAWFGMAKYDASKNDFRAAYDLTQKYGGPAALPRISSNASLIELESQFRASPDNYAIGYELYRAQQQAGRTDDALNTLRHFSERRNSPVYFKYLESQLWAEKQDYERAWKAWESFHAAQTSAK